MEILSCKSTEMSDSQNSLDGSDRNSEIGNSIESLDTDNVHHESSSYYSTESDDGSSLIPEWKDDGDDSICTNIYNVGDHDIESGCGSYNIQRIPSTLEFTIGQGKIDCEGEHEPYFSPSSVSYSQVSRNLRRIEMMEDDFPSLPVISITPWHPVEEPRSSLDLDVDPVDADTTKSKRHNSFRRRLNTSVTEMGSTDTNPPLSTLSLKSSSSSRHNMFRSAPRFVLMFGSLFIVMLSVHDSMKNSRQYYRQQYQLLSSDIANRRQEIAFPLTQVKDNSDEIGMADRVLNTREENSNAISANLPKYYLPKIDQSNTDMIHGSVSAGRPGGNLVMARSHRSRPIFVPDIPLPGGGFKKPSERFVFDPQELEQKEAQQRSMQHLHDNDSSSPAWTTWLASLTLIGMLFESGWKGYRRNRNVAVSLRDE